MKKQKSLLKERFKKLAGLTQLNEQEEDFPWLDTDNFDGGTFIGWHPYCASGDFVYAGESTTNGPSDESVMNYNGILALAEEFGYTPISCIYWNGIGQYGAGFECGPDIDTSLVPNQFDSHCCNPDNNLTFKQKHFCNNNMGPVSFQDIIDACPGPYGPMQSALNMSNPDGDPETYFNACATQYFGCTSPGLWGGSNLNCQTNESYTPPTGSEDTGSFDCEIDLTNEWVMNADYSAAPEIQSQVDAGWIATVGSFCNACETNDDGIFANTIAFQQGCTCCPEEEEDACETFENAPESEQLSICSTYYSWINDGDDGGYAIESLEAFADVVDDGNCCPKYYCNVSTFECIASNQFNNPTGDGEFDTLNECQIAGCGPDGCPGVDITTVVDWSQTGFETVENFCGRCAVEYESTNGWAAQNLPEGDCDCCETVDDTEYATNMITGCDGFNNPNFPQDFRDLICTQCEDPTYVNVHCECCEEGVNWEPEGMALPDTADFSMGTPSPPQGMPNINTPGAPQPKNYKGGGTDPQYLKDKASFIKKMELKQKTALKEVKQVLRFRKLSNIKKKK